MQIVDAQIHTWGSGLPSNQSHRQVTHFTPAEAIALMDEGGVDAAVIHPPGWDPNSTAMALKAVTDYPGRFAIMGALPLDRPQSRTRIATWRQQPGMLGLRYGFLTDPMRRWLADGTLDWLWAAAEAAGVPTLRLKLIATTLSGALMGMAGAPLPYYVTYLDPASSFSLSYAVNSVAMPVIGGMTSWIGPVIGAVLLGTIQQVATVTISSALNLLIVGLLLIGFVIVAPNGIIGLIQSRRRARGAR